MSGLEIAGLALGALPIVLSMLNSYAKSWGRVDALFHHAEEVRKFRLDLNTEWVIFRDTCENLLENRLDPGAIERLFAPPSSPITERDRTCEDEWAAVRRALEGWIRPRTIEVFVENVQEMNLYLSELSKIYPKDLDSLTENSSRAYYRKIRKAVNFQVLQSKHQEIQCNVRRINGTIQALIKNVSVAYTDIDNGTKKVTKAVELYKKTRECAKVLYEVLRDTLNHQCGCSLPHHTGIRLDIRTDSIKDQQHLSPLRFRTFLTVKVSHHPSWQGLDIEKIECASEHSDGNDIREYHDGANTLAPTAIANKLQVPSSEFGRPPSPSNLSRLKFWKKKKTVSFQNAPELNSPISIEISRPVSRAEFDGGGPSVSPSSSLSRSPSPAVPEIPTVDLLCQYILSTTGSPPLHPYAHLKSTQYPQNSLRIFPIIPVANCPSIPESHRTVTLLELFERPRFKFTLRVRLQLAARLASSVLQLYSSGWIDEDWDSTDISFLEGSDGRVEIDSPLATGRIRKDEVSTKSPAKLPIWCGRDRTLLSLGIVLVELWHGQGIAGSNDPADQHKDPLIIGYPKAQCTLEPQQQRILRAFSLADELKDNAALAYEAAVWRCLKGLDYPGKSLEDSGYMGEVHSKIFDPLRDTLEKAFPSGNFNV